MSDPTHPGDPTSDERDDLIAAEYVLGTLDAAERRAARERAEVDGGFAARIHAWEGRFAPLNDAYPEVTPPDVLAAVEARLFPAPRPAPRRWSLLGWRGAALGGGLVAALAVVALLIGQPEPAGPALRAEMAAAEVELAFVANWDSSAGVLEVTRQRGAPAEPDRDYELWVIDDSGVPRSLGILREAVTRIAAPLEAGQVLAVSLEPLGGSPVATPTGPVLALGELAAG